MVLDGWAAPGSILGHEYSAVVQELGSSVQGWSVGDRVVGGPVRACGACAWCERGRTNLCAGRPRIGVDPTSGAFAGHRLVDQSCLYRVPDRVDLRTAALTEPLAVALRGVERGVERAGALPGAVLVSGAGPIGLLTVAVLAARGVSDITVSEPSPARRERALRLGARRCVHPDELDVPALPMDTVAEPYAVALECSGHPVATETALANLDRGGVMVLSGTGMHRPRFDTVRIILNELTVTGTFEYTPDDYAAALDLLAAGAIPTDAVLEAEDQPLGRLQWAMEELSQGRLTGKVLVRPDA